MRENKMIFQVLSLFDKREKMALLGIFILTSSLAITEMIGVAIIFPFIGMISDPNVIMENKVLHFFYEMLPVSSEQQFLLWFAGGVIALILFKNLYYVFVLYVQQNYLVTKRVELTTLLYQGYLRKPYPFHLENNNAMLLRNINQVDGIFSSLLQPLFQVIAEALTIISITCFLFYVSPLMTIAIVILVGVPAIVITRVLKFRFRALGKKSHELIGVTSKAIIEGLGAIKEIQVMNSVSFFSELYAKSAIILGKVRRDQQVMNQLPRLVIEVIVIGAIVLVVLVLVFRQQNLAEALPLIALFCTAAIRQMASFNKIISGFNSMHFGHVLQNTICLELQEIKCMDGENEKVTQHFSSDNRFFNKCLKFDQVYYRYAGASKDAVHNVTIEIPKNSSVAFVGTSGSGKSTLVNIIMGLLPPDSGVVSADGRNIKKRINDWRKCIGYIPQEVYLLDDTLRRNIAFGIPDDLINEAAVCEAIKMAQLESVVQDLPNGVDTTIGERGVLLSGGQRQRIAIARALYLNPDVLILDEATSALDNRTESEVTSGIELLNGKKTIIIIAHRLATVKKCDRIYFMVEGKISAYGNYDELLRNHHFRVMAGLQSEGVVESPQS